MKIALSEAKAKLTTLVRRAEAGEPVVLTRNGKAVARIVKEKAWGEMTPEERYASLSELVASFPPLVSDGRTTRDIQNELDDDIWESHGLLGFIGSNRNSPARTAGTAMHESARRRA